MAVDMFIKIGDIKGEAQDDAHKEEIDVISWSWGMEQSGATHSGGGSGSGKVSIHDLHFTKFVDKATPNLMLMCSNGKHIPEAVLTVRKAGETPLEYLIITMTDLIINEVSTGGDNDDDRPTEQVSLNFGAVKLEYQPQKADGSPDGGKISYGWDIKANKAK
jgi:type VI secretion system secreted protein Hcp